MKNAFFYISIVLIWGVTWIAIKFQTDLVAAENSVFYRFFGASALMLFFLYLTKKLHPLTLKDHAFCLLQGACLFGFNYYVYYIATQYLESGLLSVIFSTVTIFNVVNNRLWYKVVPSRNTVIGSFIGIFGLVILFHADFSNSLSGDADSRLLGFLLAILGTFFFSSGNMVTVRHNKNKLPVVTTTAWGMLYGSLIMCIISWFYLGSFSFDTSPKYLWTLGYLIIFGSIIGFVMYLTLVNEIGPNKTAYVTVLFPIVALTISAFVEDYTFTPISIIGLILAIVGNVIVFYKPRILAKS